MLWHRHYVHVEFVDRRTYPVRWWSRQIARRWWAAKFCSRIRNIYRRVSSVFVSPSTWNANRGGKFLIEGSRCRILVDLFCSHRAIVPKSWSLFGFIFAMKAVFIRNSMAWWHLSSERHRQQICWFLDRLTLSYSDIIWASYPGKRFLFRYLLLSPQSLEREGLWYSFFPRLVLLKQTPISPNSNESKESLLPYYAYWKNQSDYSWRK